MTPKMHHDIAIEQALRHHRAGRRLEAESLCRQVLQGQPGHAGALHLLAVMAHAQRRLEPALDLARLALAAVWPTFAAPAAGPPQVADARGVVMTYWGSPYGPTSLNPAAGTFATALLTQDTGRCGAWCQLLIGVLAAQRVTAKQVSVTVAVPKTALPGWGKPTTSLVVEPSLPAQGTPKPFNSFDDHAIVILTGASASLAPFSIFDPSYGKKYAAAAGATSFTDAEQAWANASVSQVVDTYSKVSLTTGLLVFKTVISDVTPALVAGPPAGPALFTFKDLSGAVI